MKAIEWAGERARETKNEIKQKWVNDESDWERDEDRERKI